MKRTFWSFFEEPAEGVCANSMQVGTQTGTFSREGFDQDNANQALNNQLGILSASHTKTSSREESDQDASAICSFKNIPQTITKTRENTKTAMSQLAQISFDKKKTHTATEAVEEEHARASNLFSYIPKTQTRTREENDQDMALISSLQK